MQLKHNAKEYFVYFSKYILWVSTRPIMNLGITSELATNVKNLIRASYHFLVLDPILPYTTQSTGALQVYWSMHSNFEQ